MERVRIAALFADKEQYGGASVTVCGWAKTIRDMKTFGFIELNDGSCFRNLQVVMDANSLSNYKEIAAQNVGAALIVRGTVVLTPEAKQPLEVKATEIEVEGVSSPDYPLQKKRHSVEYLRTIQHLRPRTNLFSAAFRVRSAAAYAVHEFFQSRGFVYVRENESLMDGAQSIVENALERCVDEHVRDWNSVKKRARIRPPSGWGGSSGCAWCADRYSCSVPRARGS